MSEISSSARGMASRGRKRPHSRICGITRAGMNCTAWNSVRANAETNRPSAQPRTALATATTTSIHTGPEMRRSSRVALTSTARADWIAATRPKASA